MQDKIKEIKEMIRQEMNATNTFVEQVLLQRILKNIDKIQKG